MEMSTSTQQLKLTLQQRLDPMLQLVLTSSFTKVRIRRHRSPDRFAWSVDPLLSLTPQNQLNYFKVPELKTQWSWMELS